MLYKGAFSRGDPAGDPLPFAMLMAEASGFTDSVFFRGCGTQLLQTVNISQTINGYC